MGNFGAVKTILTIQLTLKNSNCFYGRWNIECKTQLKGSNYAAKRPFLPPRVHYGDWKEITTKNWKGSIFVGEMAGKWLLIDNLCKVEKAKLLWGWGKNLTGNITFPWRVFANHFSLFSLYSLKGVFHLQTLLWKLLHLPRPTAVQNWLTWDGGGGFFVKVMISILPNVTSRWFWEIKPTTMATLPGENTRTASLPF